MSQRPPEWFRWLGKADPEQYYNSTGVHMLIKSRAEIPTIKAAFRARRLDTHVAVIPGMNITVISWKGSELQKCFLEWKKYNENRKKKETLTGEKESGIKGGRARKGKT